MPAMIGLCLYHTGLLYELYCCGLLVIHQVKTAQADLDTDDPVKPTGVIRSGRNVRHASTTNMHTRNVSEASDPGISNPLPLPYNHASALPSHTR